MDEVSVSPEVLGNLLVFSLRYAVRRRTIISHMMPLIIRQHWRDIDDHERAILRSDLAEAIAELADDCHADQWHALLAWMGGAPRG